VPGHSGENSDQQPDAGGRAEADESDRTGQGHRGGGEDDGDAGADHPGPQDVHAEHLRGVVPEGEQVEPPGEQHAGRQRQQDDRSHAACGGEDDLRAAAAAPGVQAHGLLVEEQQQGCGGRSQGQGQRAPGQDEPGGRPAAPAEQEDDGRGGQAAGKGHQPFTQDGEGDTQGGDEDDHEVGAGIDGQGVRCRQVVPGQGLEQGTRCAQGRTDGEAREHARETRGHEDVEDTLVSATGGEVGQVARVDLGRALGQVPGRGRDEQHGHGRQHRGGAQRATGPDRWLRGVGARGVTGVVEKGHVRSGRPLTRRRPASWSAVHRRSRYRWGKGAPGRP